HFRNCCSCSCASCVRCSSWSHFLSYRHDHICRSLRAGCCFGDFLPDLREPGHIVGVTDIVHACHAFGVGRVGLVVLGEAQQEPGPGHRTMGTVVERHDLDGDVRPFCHVQQMLQLCGHDLGTTDDGAQRALVHQGV